MGTFLICVKKIVPENSSLQCPTKIVPHIFYLCVCSSFTASVPCIDRAQSTKHISFPLLFSYLYFLFSSLYFFFSHVYLLFPFLYLSFSYLYLSTKHISFPLVFSYLHFFLSYLWLFFSLFVFAIFVFLYLSTKNISFSLCNFAISIFPCLKNVKDVDISMLYFRQVSQWNLKMRQMRDVAWFLQSRGCATCQRWNICKQEDFSAQNFRLIAP